MTRDTRIALFLIGELVAALRANDPDAFRGLLSEGMQELGVTEVEELLLDWLNSFLNVDERDKMKLSIPCDYPAKFHETETENNL